MDAGAGCRQTWRERDYKRRARCAGASDGTIGVGERAALDAGHGRGDKGWGGCAAGRDLKSANAVQNPAFSASVAVAVALATLPDDAAIGLSRR